MKKDIEARKQDAVRDAIFDVAIDLFHREGFSETTVDEIADAAGISPRSFFRYFATKGDVLGYNVVRDGKRLVAALETCPPNMAPLDLIREISWASVQFAEATPEVRRISEIAARSVAARQAHKTGRVEVEDQLSEAFAIRMKCSNKFNLRPRMMALLTMDVVDLTLASWFTGEFKACSAAFENAITQLSRVLGNQQITATKAIAGKR